MVMNAYQNLLDFFSIYGRERLDGLSESNFSGMCVLERAKAFQLLLEQVLKGGTDESVNGLFLADPLKAAPIVKDLLEKKTLRDSAEIAAAWNLYSIEPDPTLLNVFIKHMSNPDKRLRSRAAFYVPADHATPELIDSLKGMIRTETESLPAINATNKLLECFGITRETVSKEEFSRFYRPLRSDDLSQVEAGFALLDRSVHHAGQQLIGR